MVLARRRPAGLDQGPTTVIHGNRDPLMPVGNGMCGWPADPRRPLRRASRGRASGAAGGRGTEMVPGHRIGVTNPTAQRRRGDYCDAGAIEGL